MFIDKAQFVARHRNAAGAIDAIAGAVGQEDVQHLGGANPVHNLRPRQALPALAHLARQGLARRRAKPQPMLWRIGGRLHHGGKQRRHGAEDRWLMIRHDAVDRIGRRTSAE